MAQEIQAPQVPDAQQVPEAPEPPDLRASDKRGNVRPADDRFLSSSQKRKRDKHVAEVEQTEAAQAAAIPAPEDDPFADATTITKEDTTDGN